MLVDFDFNFGQFSIIDQGTMRFMTELHMLNTPLYYTGSRYLNNKFVTDETDYDFFTNQDIGRTVTNLGFNSRSKVYRFNQTVNYRYTATKRYISNTYPKIDIFYISDEEIFEKYMEANYDLKQDVEKSKNINKEDRINYYIERTGYNVANLRLDHFAAMPAPIPVQVQQNEWDWGWDEPAAPRQLDNDDTFIF